MKPAAAAGSTTSPARCLVYLAIYYYYIHPQRDKSVAHIGNAMPKFTAENYDTHDSPPPTSRIPTHRGVYKGGRGGQIPPLDFYYLSKKFWEDVEFSNFPLSFLYDVFFYPPFRNHIYATAYTLSLLSYTMSGIRYCRLFEFWFLVFSIVYIIIWSKTFSIVLIF